MAYDLEQLKQRHSLADYIGRHVKLKKEGGEWVGLSPFQKEKTPSFKVCEAKGFWHDFSSGAHGDLLDFVQLYHRVTLPEACDILGGQRIAPNTIPAPRAKPEPEPLLPAEPIPDSHEPFTPGHPIRAWNPKEGGREVTYKPDYVWPHHDAGGDLVGYVLRLNMERGKLFIPLRYTTRGWTVQHLPKPRPLYNLPALEMHGQVFLVEGEKSADACQALLGFPALSWGGSNAPAHVDFSGMQGRRVVVWGDADEPGEKAAQVVAALATKAGAIEVKVIPWDRDKTKGWDAADAHEGWTDPETGEVHDAWSRADTLAWLKSRAVLFDGVDIVEPISDESEPPETGHLSPTPFEWCDPKSIPPIEWLYGSHFIRRYVSATIAPGGLGKSSLLQAEALAMASGRPILSERVHGKLRVWYWSGEDGQDDNRRRTISAAIQHGLKPDDFASHLFQDSGREKAISIATDERVGVTINTAAVEELITHIIDNHIDVLIIDPFVTIHTIQENDNSGINAVMSALRLIADRANCAVELVHHIRKPGAGVTTPTDVNDARGASAIIGAVRSARVLNAMSAEEAEHLDLVDDRMSYFRVDRGKSNLAPKSDKAIWRRIVGHHLENGTDEYPMGDSVPVVIHFDAPEAFHHIPPDAANIAQIMACDGKYRADQRSNEWFGYAVAERFGMNPIDKKHLSTIKKFIENWIKNGVLKVEMRIDNQRKSRPHIIPGKVEYHEDF